VIHVPARDLGEADGDDDREDDGAAPAAKKRTRRGSRGGKNRRKKPAGAATATAELGTDVELDESPGELPDSSVDEPPAREPTPEAPSTNGAAERAPDAPESDEDWGYTPMSEWGLDDK
jgi:hypothetical protein